MGAERNFMQNLPQRKNLRLNDYDYTNTGYYFITMCTKDRKEILSKIEISKEYCTHVRSPAPTKNNNGNKILYK